ncbi:MAG: MFS transporter [Candidatus Altiarchaeota archaeon]
MYTSIINFLLFGADNMSRIFLPNLVKELGASDMELGLIVGIYSAMTFTAHYIFGRASDMHGRRIILRTGLLLSAITFMLQVFTKDYSSLFLARALAGFTMGIAPAALIAYVYEAKESIGKFSSYGAFGWFTGSIIAGVLVAYNRLFTASSIFLFIAFLISLKMPSSGTKKIHVPFFPVKLIKKNVRIYVQYFLRHVGANMTWTIYPIYLAGIGASPLWVGVTYAVNTGTQAIVMRRLDKYDNRKLISRGLFLSIIFFGGLAMATNYIQVIPLSIVLGFSWAFLYVGSLESLLEGNVERATATGLLNSTINSAGIVGPLAAGVIATLAGYRAAVAVSALLCIIAYVDNRLSKA